MPKAGQYGSFGGGWSAGMHPRGRGGKFIHSSGGTIRRPTPGFTGGFVAAKTLRTSGRMSLGAAKLSGRALVGTAKLTYKGGKAVSVGAVHLGVKGYRHHRVSATRKNYLHSIQQANRRAVGHRNLTPKPYSKRSKQSIDRSHRQYARALERSAMSSARKRHS